MSLFSKTLLFVLSNKLYIKLPFLFDVITDAITMSDSFFSEFFKSVLK